MKKHRRKSVVSLMTIQKRLFIFPFHPGTACFTASSQAHHRYEQYRGQILKAIHLYYNDVQCLDQRDLLI